MTDHERASCRAKLTRRREIKCQRGPVRTLIHSYVRTVALTIRGTQPECAYKWHHAALLAGVLQLFSQCPIPRWRNQANAKNHRAAKTLPTVYSRSTDAAKPTTRTGYSCQPHTEQKPTQSLVLSRRARIRRLKTFISIGSAAHCQVKVTHWKAADHVYGVCETACCSKAGGRRGGGLVGE